MVNIRGNIDLPAAAAMIAQFSPAKQENDPHTRRNRPTCTSCVYGKVFAGKRAEKLLLPPYGLRKPAKKTVDIRGVINPPTAAATTARSPAIQENSQHKRWNIPTSSSYSHGSYRAKPLPSNLSTSAAGSCPTVQFSPSAILIAPTQQFSQPVWKACCSLSKEERPPTAQTLSEAPPPVTSRATAQSDATSKQDFGAFTLVTCRTRLYCSKPHTRSTSTLNYSSMKYTFAIMCNF